MTKKVKTFMFVAMLAGLGPYAAKGALTPKYLNEWMFDQDPAGQTLSAATNSGVDGAAFSDDVNAVTRTDGLRGLVCSNDVAGSGGLWTDGAVLTADVTNAAAGDIRFLRYDFDYDMTAGSNDSGTLLGMSFSDGSGTNFAGLVLKYTPASTNDFSAPANLTESAISTPDLTLSGHISVIAKIDLTGQEMSAWYDLGGGFNSSNDPNATIAVTNLTSIDDLVFQATGDFIATSSNECVRIDNIRTAASWAEIIEPVVDLTASPVLTIDAELSLGTGMSVGETNQVTVTISNADGIASNVVASLSVNPGSGLSIIASNNAPVILGGGRSTEQTFQVVADAVGQYVLTITAESDGGFSSMPVELSVVVGKQISYYSHSVTNDLTGQVSGVVEPGEVFDLIVTSINDGAKPVSGITNSLIPVDGAYFSVLSNITSQVYGTLNVGDTSSTVYRVSCSGSTANGAYQFKVINRTAEQAWTNLFELSVLRQGILAFSSDELTIRVVPGGTNAATVALSNTGNAETHYAVSFDENVPVEYNVNVISETRYPFRHPSDFYPATVFGDDLWVDGVTAFMNIGFDFVLFGETYTQFSVSTDGVMTLKAPAGDTIELVPFSTSVDSATVRYQKDSGRLVVAWGSDGVDNNGSEFQVWLSDEGTVEYLYEYGTWGSGAISLGDQPISHVPGTTGRDCLLLTSAPWVSCTPSDGDLSGMGAEQSLTLTAAVPAWQSIGTYSFVAAVSGEGTADSIIVNVIVEEPEIWLKIPDAFTFYGEAGSISPEATLVVSNGGNIPVSYSITDVGAQSAGYAVDYTDYLWSSIPISADTLLDETDIGSTPVDIGFPLFLDGGTYTNLTVYFDGLLFGDLFLSVFSADLQWDENSSVRVLGNAGQTRLVVTWENLALVNGGDDQTYQAVLNRDGTFRFNYKLLEGDGLMMGEDPVTETVYTIGNVSLVTDGLVETGGITGESNVVSRIAQQSLMAVPVQSRIITFEPAAGTVAVGEVAEITLRGDARSLTAGGVSNSVTSSTSLQFDYDAVSKAVAVDFIATNSVETAYPAASVLSAMWGSETPEVTSVVNSDGSRTLSWPAADDSLSRIYKAWYTTSLSDPWEWLATVTNGTFYTDSVHIDEPVIFYKVTVE